MVNPSLAPLVDTLTPMRPMPLGVITCPRTTAARLREGHIGGSLRARGDNYRNSQIIINLSRICQSFNVKQIRMEKPQVVG